MAYTSGSTRNRASKNAKSARHSNATPASKPTETSQTTLDKANVARDWGLGNDDKALERALGRDLNPQRWSTRMIKWLSQFSQAGVDFATTKKLLEEECALRGHKSLTAPAILAVWDRGGSYLKPQASNARVSIDVEDDNEVDEQEADKDGPTTDEVEVEIYDSDYVNELAGNPSTPQQGRSIRVSRHNLNSVSRGTPQVKLHEDNPDMALMMITQSLDKTYNEVQGQVQVLYNYDNSVAEQISRLEHSAKTSREGITMLEEKVRTLEGRLKTFEDQQKKRGKDIDCICRAFNQVRDKYDYIFDNEYIGQQTEAGRNWGDEDAATASPISALSAMIGSSGESLNLLLEKLQTQKELGDKARDELRENLNISQVTLMNNKEKAADDDARLAKLKAESADTQALLQQVEGYLTQLRSMK